MIAGKANVRETIDMAKKAKKSRTKRRAWSKGDVTALRGHSKKKTPVASIARTLKRSAGAIRQKALSLGLPIGHRR
jgi:NADH:ubiquinone oxidoreductase subunit